MDSERSLKLADLMNHLIEPVFAKDLVFLLFELFPKLTVRALPNHIAKRARSQRR